MPAGGQSSYYVYDGQHISLELRSVTNESQATSDVYRRIMHGVAIDEVLAEETVWGTSWALSDHLGTIHDWVDATTGTITHYVYSAFGRILSIDGGEPKYDTHLFGFTGRETDADTLITDHWMYYRARYYNPSTGRFVSQDPIGFLAGDANLYRYVGNWVTGATDPSGLWGEPTFTRNELTETFGVRWNAGNRMENWAYGYGELNHTKHRIVFALPIGSDAEAVLEQAYRDLAAFKYFNDGNNNFARIYLDRVDGQLYAGFDVETLIKGTSADIVHLCDKAGVKLDLFPQYKLVEARTVGNHPLVGVRRWRAYVETETIPDMAPPVDFNALFRGTAQRKPTGRKLLVIETESYDKVSGRLNYVAMNMPVVGLAADQLRIWELYFLNIRDAYGNSAEYLPHRSNIKGIAYSLPATTTNPWRCPDPEIRLGIRR